MPGESTAALEAAHGDLDRAIQDNKKAMERHVVEPDDGDWFVIGRIEEQLGLTGDATAAYKRVTRPAGDDQLVSAYQLAQARRSALGARP